MSYWSSEFKRKMLLLRLAYKDQETGEVVLGNYGEIHDGVLVRLNDKRESNGLRRLTYDESEHEGRGYIKKSDGEFMVMKDAIDWACEGGYSEYDRWSGESIALRHKQVEMGGKKYW